MTEGGTVLIVDDEIEICWALQRILQKIGCTSLCAVSGKGALEMAEKTPFDLALVDAKLPDQKGIDVVLALRARLPSLRAILISGYLFEDDPGVRSWVDDGLIFGFISKPFSIAQVRVLVQRALTSRGPATSPESYGDRSQTTE